MSSDEVRPFDIPERRDLIRRVLDLDRRAERAEVAGDPGWPELAAQLAALRREYARRVPRPIVSYDPVAGEPFRLGIDIYGLDGFWWELDGPDRLRDEPLPLTWYAFHGAMRLKRPYEDNPFTVKVGPTAPFVVPRLLQRPNVVAVISTVRIGLRHTGWLTVYFAPWPDPPPGLRINEWARNSYRFRIDPGPFSWGESLDFPPEWDFDLRPWIGAGKVLWTPPDSPGAVARSDIECPYLNLRRRRDPEGPGVLASGRLTYSGVPPDFYLVDNPNVD